MPVGDLQFDEMETTYRSCVAEHERKRSAGLLTETNPLLYQGPDFQTALYVSLRLRGHSRSEISRVLQERTVSQNEREGAKVAEAHKILEQSAAEARQSIDQKWKEASPELRMVLQKQRDDILKLGF